MYPETRGRISTDSTGSNRPVNSSHSLTSFSITVTTLTGNGACCCADFFLHPAVVRKIDNIPMLTKRFFICRSSISNVPSLKCSRLGFDKCEQVGVDCFCLRGGH